MDAAVLSFPTWTASRTTPARVSCWRITLPVSLCYDASRLAAQAKLSPLA